MFGLDVAHHKWLLAWYNMDFRCVNKQFILANTLVFLHP